MTLPLRLHYIQPRFYFVLHCLVVTSICKLRILSKKTERKRKFKQDLKQYKEEDIKRALRKDSKLVSYVERQDLLHYQILTFMVSWSQFPWSYH